MLFLSALQATGKSQLEGCLTILITWAPIAVLVLFWIVFSRRMGYFSRKGGYVKRSEDYMVRSQEHMARVEQTLDKIEDHLRSMAGRGEERDGLERGGSPADEPPPVVGQRDR